MPPKQKFTKDQLIDAAFSIAVNEGFDAITIRHVAKTLGSSIAPIYVNYNDVEALKEDAIKKSILVFNEILNAQTSANMFLNYGLASIAFAKTYPLLYDELVIKDKHTKLDTSLEEDPVFIAVNNEACYSELTLEEKTHLVIKMKALQAGLSLMARKEKFNQYIHEERIVRLLKETEEDIINGLLERRKELND